MARMGDFDIEELEKLQNKLRKMQDKDIDKFCEDCAKELAARLIARAIKRTPVGVYGKKTEKKGGTLRRGWTTTSTGDSNRDTQQAFYSNAFGGKQRVSRKDMQVRKVGNSYVITVTNPVSYASYVEYGHRKPKGKGWVAGQFMMTISEKEVQRIAPKVLEKKLQNLLVKTFRG